MQLLNVFDKALVQSIKAIKAKDGRLMKICNKKTIIKIKDGFNQSDDCVDDCVDDRVIAVQYSLKRSRTTKNRRQKRNGEENVSETE